MTNGKRIEVEQDIVKRYIKAVIDGGWNPVLLNTGDESKTYDADDIFEADQAMISFSKEGKAAFLFFVYGNEPGEVLNDYSVRLESLVAPVNEYADGWA